MDRKILMRELALLVLLGLVACQPVTDGNAGLHITADRGSVVNVYMKANGATTSTPTTTTTPTTNLSVPVSAIP